MEISGPARAGGSSKLLYFQVKRILSEPLVPCKSRTSDNAIQLVANQIFRTIALNPIHGQQASIEPAGTVATYEPHVDVFFGLVKHEQIRLEQHEVSCDRRILRFVVVLCMHVVVPKQHLPYSAPMPKNTFFFNSR